jgi:hypothetical protein
MLMSVRALLVAGGVLAAGGFVPAQEGGKPERVPTGGDEPGFYFGVPGATATLPEIPIPDGATPLSVEFRFKAIEKLTSSLKVVSRWDPQAKGSDRGTFYIELGPSGKIAFGLLAASGISKTITARAAWQEGVWHHVAAVWDGREASLHVNGKRVAGETLEGFGPLASSRLPLVLGPAADSRGRTKESFEGFLSDVAVWNSVVSTPSAAPLSGRETGLVAYVPLRGKAGNLTLSPALARAGSCRTAWWYDANPGRPYLHLFTCDPDIGDPARAILIAHESRGEVGILWQEKGSLKVRLTWVGSAWGEPRTIEAPGLPGALLAAGAGDARGNVYTLMVEPGPGDRLKAAMFAFTPDGRLLKEAPLDTSSAAYNIYEYGGRWVGSMAISKDSGCFILPRTMHMGGDGLRHQGAIAVTFAADLSRFQNLGQTSGHSFGNVLTVGSRGEFLGIDLGDNYPRGVHLHRIAAGARTSRVVFTYKTAHATSPRNGSPVYAEISGGGRTFYRWSNDNQTYTELGGLVEGRATYSIAFATERSPEGKVLDNRRAGIPNEPRDVAMLRVVKNFEKAPEGMQVSDAIMAGLPPGSKPETGGFYDFGGRWVDQRVTGVLWLTNYPPGEAARAPQLFRRRDGTITILWEKTGGSDGPCLYALTVDESGRKLWGPARIGADLALAREFLPVRVGERIFTLIREGSRTLLAYLQDK